MYLLNCCVHMCVQEKEEGPVPQFAPSVIFISPPFHCTFPEEENVALLILMSHVYYSGPHRLSSTFW